MFAVINHMEIKLDHAGKVDELFVRNARLMKECAGFLSMTLLRPEDSPSSRRLFALWESKDAYERYKKSDVFRKTHAGVDVTWFQGPPRVEKMDVAFAVTREEPG